MVDFIQYLTYAPVSLALLVTILTVSLYCYFIDNSLFERLILHPFSVLKNKNYFAFLTSGFLHGDLTHLAVNSVFIFYFAFTLEHITGSLAVFILLFSTIIACNYVVFLRYKNNVRVYNLGASGALVAVLVSQMLLNPAHKVKLFLIPASVPAALFIGAYVCYLFFAVKNKYDNINNEPHLVGAIAGFIFTIVVHPAILRQLF